MRVKVLLQITGEDGNAAAAQVAVFEKQTERPEDLGLSIAEGKALMAAVQQRVVDAQVASWAERHRCCEACGARRHSKGSYPVVFLTLYGDVRVASPRLHRCPCQGADGPSDRVAAAQPDPRLCCPGAALPRDPLGIARALRRRGRAARRHLADRRRCQWHHATRPCAACGRAGRRHPTFSKAKIFVTHPGIPSSRTSRRQQPRFHARSNIGFCGVACICTKALPLR